MAFRRNTLDKLNLIGKELASHIPFTALGALTGIVFMLIVFFGNFLDDIAPSSESVFYVLHPAHVILSALVTTSLYRIYGRGGWWAALIIGYTGAIGIATLSDSIVPYMLETLLDLPNRRAEIGFIEEPLIVNPAAFIGVALGYVIPTTKLPHFGHVLISTWASLFHIIMALEQSMDWLQLLATFVFLVLAVWIPCCLSDIAYPLLFVKEGKEHYRH